MLLVAPVLMAPTGILTAVIATDRAIGDCVAFALLPEFVEMA
jgi:hypothetical protein